VAAYRKVLPPFFMLSLRCFDGDDMQYINWIFRAALFVVLLGFALKNDQPVTLRYFFGYEWQSSLVVALLIFFAAGVVVGVVSMLASVLRQGREIARLKREIHNMKNFSRDERTQAAPTQTHQ
jgi:putative membrane protein